jgi:hypothetical protein
VPDGVLENLKVEFVNATFCRLEVVLEDGSMTTLTQCNYDVAGDRITMKAVKPPSGRNGAKMEITYVGKISGNFMAGTAKNHTTGVSWPWSVRKDR